MYRQTVPSIALVAILAFAAAGCGGQSAEEKYANSVCSDISDWKDQIEKSANDVKAKIQSPEVGMLAAIETEIQEAVDATNQLASNLKSLEPPDTQEGRSARQQLEALASKAQTTANKAKQTVSSIPQGASITQTAQQLASLAPEINSLAVNTSSTLASVKETGEKMKDGFEDADSCKKLKSSSS
jgi:sugar-specific transcriptional regulator TrmB